MTKIITTNIEDGMTAGEMLSFKEMLEEYHKVRFRCKLDEFTVSYIEVEKCGE